MFVAGDHAINDTGGDDEDSWKSKLTQRGYSVEVLLRGIGEFRVIQEMFVKHAQVAKDNFEG